MPPNSNESSQELQTDGRDAKPLIAPNSVNRLTFRLFGVFDSEAVGNGAILALIVIALAVIVVGALKLS